MKYFYSASVMGYGNGRYWHKFHNFPYFERVTKTLTLNSRIGMPFAVIRYGNNIWNKVSLHNPGFSTWRKKYWDNFSDELRSKIIISIAGTDEEIKYMIYDINTTMNEVAGIEINLSCPNVKSFLNTYIPKSYVPLYIKINHRQDPYNYDLDRVAGIRLNSVPMYCGGVSGEKAKKYNWPMICQWIKEGLNVAGCSAVSLNDFEYLKDIGCKEIGVGSIILINPSLIENLK